MGNAKRVSFSVSVQFTFQHRPFIFAHNYERLEQIGTTLSALGVENTPDRNVVIFNP